MNKRLALAVSVLAHPVFVNLLCLYCLFLLYPPLSHGMPQRIQLFYISFIFLSTSIVPLILVLVMRITGNLKSITLEDKAERRLPYLFTIALYIFNYYNFFRSPTTHALILAYLLACTAIVTVVFVVNYFNKISIHLATLGALAGLLTQVGMMGYAEVRLSLILLMLLSGLVASARLSLKAHTNKQLYAGFLLGFVLMFLILHLSFTFV